MSDEQRWTFPPEVQPRADETQFDLSRALDVETELELWENLAAAGLTVLAVSHRAVAFDRADQVLWLEAGRLITEPATLEPRFTAPRG